MDEAIVSTPGHKYYLPENTVCREVGEKHEHAGYDELSVKWVSACNLKKGDKVLLSDGKYGIVSKTKVEHLSEPETTYNFEVADFHTYYVGESGVCVHNTKCWKWSSESSLQQHYIDHGMEVGASSVDDYFNMAASYADDVMQNGTFIKNVPNRTPTGIKGVQRFTLGDNYYVDIVKNKKILVSFGELW